MATLSSAREKNALPPQQAQTDAMFARTNLFSFGIQPSHLGAQSTGEHIPGHPMIFPLTQIAPSSTAGTMGRFNTDGDSTNVKTAEVLISSPDYDNMKPAFTDTPLLVGDGVKTVSAVVAAPNGGSIASIPLKGSAAARDGAVRGGSGEGGGGRHHSTQGYKAGDGDSRSRGSACLTADGCRDVSSTAGTADLSTNDMGNDLFRARAPGVIDARVHSHAKSSQKKGISYKVKTNHVTFTDTEPAIAPKQTTRDTVLANDGRDVSSHSHNSRNSESVQDKCDVTITNNGGVALDKVRSSGNVLGSGLQQEILHVISETDRPQTNSPSIDVSSSVTAQTNTGIVFKPDPLRKTQAISSSIHHEKDQVSKTPASKPSQDVKTNGRVKEHSVTATVHSYPVLSNDFTTDKSSVNVHKLDVSSVEVPVIIITPNTPETLSPEASPSGISATSKSAGATISNIQSSGNPQEANFSENFQIKRDIKNGNYTEVEKQNHTRGKRSTPIGGVKVLPSKFTFNFRSFRETKTESSTSSKFKGNKLKTSTTSDILYSGDADPATPETESVKTASLPAAGKPSTCATTATQQPATYAPIATSQSVQCIAVATSAVQPAISTIVETSVIQSTICTTIETPVTEPAICATSIPTIEPTTNITIASAPTQPTICAAIAIVATQSVTEKPIPSAAALSTATEGQSLASEKFTPLNISESEPNRSSNNEKNGAFTRITESEAWGDYAVPSDVIRSTFSSIEPNISITENHYMQSPLACTEGQRTVELHSPSKIGSTEEDEYAVPIPKSQRQSNSRSSGSCTQSEASPNEETRSSALEYNDAFDDTSVKNRTRRARQMKKSTTLDMIQSFTFGHSNIPKNSRREYDYFSLGRRPKRPRLQTLTDSQGMAVSLDMLLRSRRQSFTEIPGAPTPEQTLSVDDILRSCFEFNQGSPCKLTRANSSKNSPTQPLTFSEANNIKLLDFDMARNGNQDRRPGVASSSLKRNQNGSRKSESKRGEDIKKNNQNSGLFDNRTNSEKTSLAAMSSCNETSKGESPTLDQAVSASRKHPLRTKTTADIDRDIINDQSPPGNKTAGFGHSSNSSAAPGTDITKKLEHVKSYYTSDAPRNAGNPMISENAAKTSLDGSGVKCQIPTGLVTIADYEYVTHDQEETHALQTSDSHTVFVKDSLRTPGNNSSLPADDSGYSSQTVSHPRLDMASQVISPQPTIPLLNEDKKTGFNTSTLTQPNTPSTSSLEAAQEAREIPTTEVFTFSSNHGGLASLPESSSSCRHPQGGDSSNPAFPCSPLSLNVSSDSAEVPSPGVMSSLSVDVSDSPSGSPSPVQRSPNYNAKLEAAEAVKWLRAAGFPQYAQMFEDGQFPVDMGVVERDHDFLDSDSIKSLFRRLVTLNKYAGMKLDSHPGKKATSEEDDEDDLCALSERWEYQKSVRRWSRKDLSPSSRKSSCTETEQGELAARSGSHDSLLADQDSGSQTGDSPLLESRMPHQGNSEMVSLSRGEQAVAEVTAEDMDQADSALSPRLRRAASEKIKTAKNLFKKMEGLKSKKTRRQLGHRDIVEISGPVVADKETMQAKLERMNCVDISPTSPTPRGGKPFNGIHRSSFAGHSSHRTPSDVSSSQISQQSASYSARPHSDFLSNPVEVKCPSTTQFTSASQTPDSRSGPTSPTQHSSLSHESSLDEYHAAHSVLLRNLQSVQGDGTAVPKRNNSDTNLLEIFLVPQDHKPGRFPRILQNGYIETEACGTAVNARTGSVRLGRGTCLASDYNSSNSSAPLSRNQALGYRVSVYDNFLPSEGKKEEDQETSGGIPGVVELGLSGNVNHQEGIDNSKPGFVQGQSSDIGFISHDNSQGRVGIASDPDTQVSAHERSVSLESSTSLRTPREGTPASEGGVISEDSQNSRKSSQDSATKSRGVAHSSSLDSYFRGSSGVRNEVSSRETSEESTSSQFQQDYDEFDRILQQLYQNINDMTNFMGMNRQEKSAKLVRAATSPLPASCKDQISPMHVAKHPTQPVVSTRVSTASSTVHSSETQRSPLDTSVSIDSYGGFEQDQDNVSSAGEGSNTAESGSEDQEAALTDMSHDDSLDQIPEVSRERRDSGVGHSLTRATGDRRRKKIRWHSFQKCHRPDVTSRAMQINSLTVGQLVRLQKLSLLRLTGIMEKCLPVSKSGWNWMLPRFMKRNKVPDFSDKNVFGVPLSIMAQRTGQPLPQCVLYAMRYLRRTCQNAVGIFRKSGVKSKIQQLRDYLEAHPDTTDFEGMNAYNVADMLKTYFRDLPECLLTNKMSETFRSIYTYVPQSQRLEAIQAAILLLPDENREVLQSILLFLSDISSHEADHQMNASNLAVCFTPTVFQLGLRQNLPYSPKRNRKNTTGIPDPREIMEQKAAHECLLMMITECKKLFTVAPNLFRQLQVQSLAYMEPTPLQDIGSSPSEVRAFGQERIQMVLKESHDKNRGWIQTSTIGDVEIFHRKPMDDCPLKEWKLVVDVEAPPIEVLRRIMHERHTWDEDMLSWSVVERLDPHSDVFQFVLNSMAPHPSRNFCVLRYWRSDLSKGACALITISVEHSDALEVQGVWAADLGTYYLMEPCGSGRARVTFLTRVDTRGRMPEWYTKIFGHISANFLERLKESFKQDASGPETKV